MLAAGGANALQSPLRPRQFTPPRIEDILSHPDRRRAAGNADIGIAADRQLQPDRQQSVRHNDSPRKITERLTLAPGTSTVKPG